MPIKYIIFLLLLGIVPLSFSSDDLSYQKRIIGGSTVSFEDNITSGISQWSWVVALIDENNDHFCGASLIGSQWLMTAAHCVYNYKGQQNKELKITALFQQSNLLTISDNDISREISRIVVHPDYNNNADDHDIALLKLDKPIDIPPINLPGRYYNAPIRATWELATILGWGLSTPYDGSGELRQAQVPIANFQDCVYNYKEYGINISLNMICAGFESGGTDACSGDSGGPLVIPHESGIGWKQIGIVSFGVGCALPKFFGVYTRVSRYDRFIQSNLCPEPPPAPTLTVQRDEINNEITLTITPAKSDDNTTDTISAYRIYYAPYPEIAPIRNYEISTSDTLKTPLPGNIAHYAIAQTLKDNCSSQFSNLILIPAF